MAVESAADRQDLLDDFGVSCTLTFSDATTSALTGILDNEFVETLSGTRVGVESQQPMLTCRTSDISGAEHGNSITVDGTSYTVRGIHPDGTGFSVLMLELV